MASEIHLRAAKASSTEMYAVVLNEAGYHWNTWTLAFEEAESGSWSDYSIALTESPVGEAHYYANFPSAIGSGLYVVRFYEAYTTAISGDDVLDSQTILWQDGSATALTSGGAIGWASLAEADEYFGEERPGASTFWSASVTDAAKVAALWHAFRLLSDCGEWWLPDTTGSTLIIRRAQCEQALFGLRDTVGIDARADLQAQGVRVAGLVQETYAGNAGITIAPIARALLNAAGYATGAANQFSVVR